MDFFSLEINRIGGGGTYDCGINKNFSELRENGVCLSLFTIIIQIEPEDYTQ